MRSWSAKPEGARARRRRLNRGNGKRLALAGVIATTSLAMILTPSMANAASSQTYFVGVPDWLPIGEGAKLPNDPVAINNAMVAAKDRNPLVAWGLGPVDLKPVWVNWYTPVNPLDPTDPGQEQYYTPGEWGQTGSHPVTVNEPNPLYDDAYDLAYDGGYKVARAAYIAKASEDASTKAYNQKYSEVYTRKYDEYIDKYCKVICNPKKPPNEMKKLADAFAKTEAAIEATKAAATAAQNAAKDPKIAAAADTAAHSAGLAAALAAVTNIPQTIEFTTDVPEFGWKKDGYWTTTTSGQWVASPEDVAALPTVGQLAYLARAVENGDLSALAPVLNWTAYLTNVNLIAYGDGAIAAGAAYQAFIDSANGNTHEGYNPFTVGDPETGPRKIRLTFGDGKVTVTRTDTTNNPLEIPLPGDLDFPDAPPVGWETVQEGGVIDVTLLSLLLVRNPGRPNGGLYSRFAPMCEELTGVNPVTPDRQDVLPEGFDPDLITKLLTGNAGDISFDELGNLQSVIESVDGEPIIVTVKADVGWQYDLMSDAPATANPIAWANSLASAVLLTNLLTGVDFGNLGAGGYVGPDGTIYYTLPVEQLPLLALPRLASAALGLATGEDINTPVADALEPVLKMLVNIGYNDVVRNADGTYTRTLDKFGEPTLFGTPTLTPAQMALLPGDFVRLLGAGVGDELTDVLTRAVTRIVERTNVGLSTEQRAQLNAMLATPGTIMKTVSAQVGQHVSTVASAVERQTPDLPSPSQAELGAQQREVGRGVATVRDGVNEAVDGVNSAAEDLKRAAGSTASPDKEAPSAVDGGANKATPESRYGGTKKNDADGGANKFTPGTIARVPGSSAANADKDAATGVTEADGDSGNTTDSGSDKSGDNGSDGGGDD
ncbi:PE-PPE domain-containing protein [Mycolicibacterium celeriflavum]|uniref:PE-PPE domain-containing protein n=1 Tax=Mycolicibacterium celeriflavum TaxID=1249101 RepID=UPI003CF002D4